MSKRDLEKALQSCLERVLSALGESTRDAILWYLKNEYEVRLARVLDDPALLTNALERIFGQGARIIEDMLAKEVARTLGHSDAKNLPETITTVRRLLLRKS